MSKWKDIRTYMEVSPYTGQEIDEDSIANVTGPNVAGTGDDSSVVVVRKKKKKSLIDARSKSYRQHRERLEKARQRREEIKSKLAQKVSETNDNFSRERFIDEQVSDYIVNTLRSIVKKKSAKPIKFSDGSMKIDMTTANMMLQVLDKINPMNRKKVMDILDKGKKADFMRVHNVVMKALGWMKTFNLYVNEDIENPYFHYRDGSSLLGPGMGQYDPIADLNAQRQVLGKLQVKGNFKEITKSDLDQIEKYADRLFGALDIDVEFTRHFLDRVNDMRNKVAITPAELTRLFKQTYKKHGKTIARLGPDAEAVITDMKTDINTPFVLNLKGGELELVAKTVMRKKNFKTTNPKLAFEDVSEARAKKAVAGGKVQKLVTAHGLTYKGKNIKK